MTSESDPNGMGQHESGAKFDNGKNRLGLVHRGFAMALEQVGLVATYGANKYTENGWIAVPNGNERYTDALYRHLNAHDQGLEMDAESNLSHLAHACWNLLAICELTQRQCRR